MGVQPGQSHTIYPNMARISTVTPTNALTSSGYTGVNQDMKTNIITSSLALGSATCGVNVDAAATNTTGRGAIFQISTIWSVGACVPNTLVQIPPAQFTSWSCATLGDVTSGPITGVTPNGANARFHVTTSNGRLMSIRISGTALGTGYIQSEVITLPKTGVGGLDADGTLGSVSSDINIHLQFGNISNSFGRVTAIIENGVGYTVGDILTLQEIGGASVGTATVSVTTLDVGWVVGGPYQEIGSLISGPGPVLTGTGAAVGKYTPGTSAPITIDAGWVTGGGEAGAITITIDATAIASATLAQDNSSDYIGGTSEITIPAATLAADPTIGLAAQGDIVVTLTTANVA